MTEGWQAPAGWQAPEPEPLASAPPAERPPRMVEIVSRGIDLNVSLSRELRRMSLYTGAMFLAAIGPIAALVVAHAIGVGGFDWLLDALGSGNRRRLDLGPFAGVVVVIGALATFAIVIDTQLLATAVTGARATGRTLGLRAALGWARQGFWRLIFGSIAVGLILAIPQRVLEALFVRGSSELQLFISTVLSILLSAPFAYVGAAVVLARATPLRAVRASWQMARRRWRLAVVIGIVNTAVVYVGGFAIGAGLDILVRIAIAFGIDRGLGAVQSFGLIVIVGFAILAIGSLVMTIAALTVAPQVIAWLRLGGPSYGIVDPDPDNPYGARPRTRLVSLPMQVALVIELVAAALSIVGGA